MEEELILKIIDIENKAQEIIKSAKQSDKDFQKNIEAETAKLHEDIEHKALAKNEMLKENELQNAEDECNNIISKSQEQIEKLYQKYNDNKEKWIDQIINNMIGD